ncbi:MAG: hypothetical protein ABJ308_03480 [Halieaceae bacterium]
MSGKQPSNWQKLITGEWHGLPSLYEPDGTHVGVNKVSRASEHVDGKTRYWMDTDFDAVGALRNRFEIGRFDFGVIDSDNDRIYTGPDFVGSGSPYGTLVDSEYYSPAWNTHLRTVNHVVPELGMQVYSSLLFEGATLIGTFNGLYIVTQDYDSNPETQQRVADWLERERREGKRPFVLPPKLQGQWKGELEVYNNEQELIGSNQVTIDYTPVNLTRANMHVKTSGVIDSDYSFERTRDQNHHQFHGPDLFGNGMAYGRYLYSVQHLYGKAERLETRDTLINEDNTMVVNWNYFYSQQRKYTTHGVLYWEAGDEILGPRFIG